MIHLPIVTFPFFSLFILICLQPDNYKYEGDSSDKDLLYLFKNSKSDVLHSIIIISPWMWKKEVFIGTILKLASSYQIRLAIKILEMWAQRYSLDLKLQPSLLQSVQNFVKKINCLISLQVRAFILNSVSIPFINDTDEEKRMEIRSMMTISPQEFGQNLTVWLVNCFNSTYTPQDILSNENERNTFVQMVDTSTIQLRRLLTRQIKVCIKHGKPTTAIVG